VTTKNPFKQATSINEFFELLRADLERLRGAKFRQWRMVGVEIRGEWLHFSLDADETTVVGGDPLSWYRVAEGFYYRGATIRSPLLQKHRGYGCFICNSTSPGFRKYSTKVHAQVTVRHMPKILKLLNRNGKHIADRACAVREDPEHVALKLARDRADYALFCRASVVANEYDKKHPQIDPLTGLPVIIRKSP